MEGESSLCSQDSTDALLKDGESDSVMPLLSACSLWITLGHRHPAAQATQLRVIWTPLVLPCFSPSSSADLVGSAFRMYPESDNFSFRPLSHWSMPPSLPSGVSSLLVFPLLNVPYSVPYSLVSTWPSERSIKLMLSVKSGHSSAPKHPVVSLPSPQGESQNPCLVVCSLPVLLSSS